MTLAGAPAGSLTTLNNSLLMALSRHPMQVLTGPVTDPESGHAEGRRSRTTEVKLYSPGPGKDEPVSPTAGRHTSRITGRLITADVDAPAREAGGQAGVLALLADGEGELEVGHGDPR